MTINAKSNEVIWGKGKSFIFGERNDMMNMKFASSMVAILAGVIISFQNFNSHNLILGKVSNTSCVTSPVAMSFTGNNSVRIVVSGQSFIPSRMSFFALKPLFLKFWVSFKSIVDFRPIIERFMTNLKAYFSYGRIFFSKSFIPSWNITSLRSFAIRMMTPDIFRIKDSPVFVSWKSSGIITTSTLAYSRFFNHAIHYTGKQKESQCKIRELLENLYKTISSQANQEWLEGSETNAYEPERLMRRHECGYRKVRYSPNLQATVRARILNNSGITNLNSIPWTGKLDALSEFDINDPVQRVLRNDMASVLDKAAGFQFKTTGRKYMCLTTATGTFESLADGDTCGSQNIAKVSPSVFHIQQIVDYLRKKNVAPYDGEDYVGIFSVNAMRSIYDDGAFQDAAKYGDPERLFAGEVGRIYNCRCIRETNYLVNTLGSSSGTNALGEGIIFGAETVMEGVAIPEELRQKIPTDYGRSHGLAWYGVMGFEKIWKHTDSGQDAHIVHITSKK